PGLYSIHINELVQTEQHLAKVRQRQVFRLGIAAIAINLALDEGCHALALGGAWQTAQRRAVGLFDYRTHRLRRFRTDALAEFFGTLADERRVHHRQGLRGYRRGWPGADALDRLGCVEHLHERDQPAALDRQVDAAPGIVLVQ